MVTTMFQHALAVVSYIPPRCRYSAESPPKFTFALNVLFSFSATVTVANLYYNHPILNKLAADFDVSYSRVSNIPTLMQAGYAGGLLFLNPLGDVLRRRTMVLALIGITASFWVGLCVTAQFEVFAALSFLTSFFTIAPQIFLPLVADLAPSNKRATSLSIVTSGLLLGMLIARILSGVVTEFVGWRIIYWISLGLQGLVFVLLWLFMPDYPATNSGSISYFRSLYSLPQLIVRHPVLVQSSLMGMFVSAIFTMYWTTLVFLLSASPYNYNSMVIGLFGLIGIAGICLGPLSGRFIIQNQHTHFSVFLGFMVAMVGQAIGAYIGSFSVAGPIIQALLLDLGIQCTQVSNRTAIYKLNSSARNCLNSVYMLTVFLGQIMGTASGTPAFERWGWIGSGSLGVGYICAGLVVLVLRGPFETRWIGWRGGWNVWKHTTEKESSGQQESQESQDDGQSQDNNVAAGMDEKTSSDEEKGTSEMKDILTIEKI